MRYLYFVLFKILTIYNWILVDNAEKVYFKIPAVLVIENVLENPNKVLSYWRKFPQKIVIDSLC